VSSSRSAGSSPSYLAKKRDWDFLLKSLEYYNNAQIPRNTIRKTIQKDLILDPFFTWRCFGEFERTSTQSTSSTSDCDNRSSPCSSTKNLVTVIRLIPLLLRRTLKKASWIPDEKLPCNQFNPHDLIHHDRTRTLSSNRTKTPLLDPFKE
jgi:hypothetical protein